MGRGAKKKISLGSSSQSLYVKKRSRSGVMGASPANLSAGSLEDDGSRVWRDSLDRLHRDGGPARILPDGGEEYYREGLLHREDGPARILSDGTQEYYIGGNLHREDGPAIIYADGSEEYYIEGFLHREDGPARIQADGRKSWYLDGKMHREDGPAFECPRDVAEKVNQPVEMWYKDGQPHRIGGPAKTWPDGREENFEDGRPEGRPKEIRYSSEIM